MISAISDVHVKLPGDEPYKLFMKFIKNPIVKSSQKVVLLGDIFDLLIGGDKKFISDYQDLFNEIKSLLREGKEIYYIEGNHDFHIERLLKETFPEDNFFFSREKIQLEHDGVIISFCHGDDIEIENASYKRYYSFMRSDAMKFLAERVVPFSISKAVGVWASARSRKKNIEKYEEQKDLIKLKFRKSAEEYFKQSPSDIIVCGHSHIKDLYESKLGFTYINNGYFPKEQSFIYIKEGSALFSELAEPSH
jgi:UDP-2,3-diacylglucosamine hydrolase